MAASANGRKAVSVGFGGEVKLWANEQEDGQGKWVEDGKLVGKIADSSECGRDYANANTLPCRKHESRRDLGSRSLRGRTVSY